MIEAHMMADGTMHIDADEWDGKITSNITIPDYAWSLFDKAQHISGYDINPKTVPIGGILYYTDGDIHSGRRIVKYGRVLEHYEDCIVLECIEPVDRRVINGIPIQEFIKTVPTPWRKLPKGWTCDTRLFDETRRTIPELENYDIKKPEDILAACEAGLFVPVRENPRVRIRVEIDKNKGWRLIPEWEYPYSKKFEAVSVDFHNAFETYDAAKIACDIIQKQLEHQANLSEYDWFVEQTDRTLNRCWNITETEREKYREFLHSRKNPEDIETRVDGGKPQWKYFRNKTWIDIVTD